MKGFSKSGSLLAIAAASGLLLTACGTTGGDSDSSASGGSCNVTLAYLGPTTGDYANLGLNIAGGAQVAIDEYKDKGGKCTVSLKKFDSQGDPTKATPLAKTIIDDESVVGVVGPAFSGESDATGAAFNEAGLVTVSASATNPDLTKNGWTTFHRVLGTDSDQGPGAAKYITDTVKAKKVFVIDDASEYGKGLADSVADTLGSAVTARDTVQQKQTDFSATVTKVKASGADAVFYGGYYAEASLLKKQLTQAGWNGTYVTGDGSLDPQFVKAAGAKAAEGTVFTCPCAPSPADFTKKYEKVNGGKEPGTYSAEGYDATNVLLAGIDAGDTTREKLLDFVNSYDADGLTKHIKFTDGDVSEVVIYTYVVKNGQIVPQGEVK